MEEKIKEYRAFITELIQLGCENWYITDITDEEIKEAVKSLHNEIQRS